MSDRFDEGGAKDSERVPGPTTSNGLGLDDIEAIGAGATLYGFRL